MERVCKKETTYIYIPFFPPTFSHKSGFFCFEAFVSKHQCVFFFIYIVENAYAVNSKGMIDIYSKNYESALLLR